MPRSKRLNLTLSELFLTELHRAAVRRKKRLPELARQLLDEGLQRLHRLEQEAQLRKAYLELARDERQSLHDFRHADLEGWI